MIDDTVHVMQITKAGTPMTVAELVEALQRLPADRRVYLDTRECFVPVVGVDVVGYLGVMIEADRQLWSAVEEPS